ncbi:Hsp70 family protein [Micromonospora sp. BRA006-A]|nr:Hsp70 family protein [Micromonospora sp. BRA006-A]
MDAAEQLVWAALRAARLTERGNRSPSELRALGPAELSRDIDYVLLAGGMSRIPYVERRIGALFPNAQVFDNAGVEPDEAIVAGLADTAGYERLNLHRPGFDFVVEWEGNGQLRQETLYAAYTPFYEPWQVLSGQSDLGYARHGRDFPGPQQGTGRLRVRATTGEPLGLMFDGQTMDGVSLTFGRDMGFKLYCDGRILIRHGSGKRVHMRVDRWPVIRGRDHAQLVLRSAEEAIPTPPTPGTWRRVGSADSMRATATALSEMSSSLLAASSCRTSARRACRLRSRPSCSRTMLAPGRRSVAAGGTLESSGSEDPASPHGLESAPPPRPCSPAAGGAQFPGVVPRGVPEPAATPHARQPVESADRP